MACGWNSCQEDVTCIKLTSGATSATELGEETSSPLLSCSVSASSSLKERVGNHYLWPGDLVPCYSYWLSASFYFYIPIIYGIFPTNFVMLSYFTISIYRSILCTGESRWAFWKSDALSFTIEVNNIIPLSQIPILLIVWVCKHPVDTVLGKIRLITLMYQEIQ